MKYLPYHEDWVCIPMKGDSDQQTQIHQTPSYKYNVD